MRKFLAFVLLAGAAVPALAAGRPHDDNARSSHADRSERSESHKSSESDHRERSERPRVEVQRPVKVERTVKVDRTVNVARDRRGPVVQQPRAVPTPPVARSTEVARDLHKDRERVVRVRRPDGPRIVSPQVTQDSRLRRSDRRVPRVLDTRAPVVSHVPREGTQPPARTQRVVRHGTHWTTEWRKDRKYDWRDWRRRHRSAFHLGFYSDPFGWNYRPYSIGWRLWPSYYGSRYWINDPWQYRLPYAPPGYRWVRYWNDAILVDTFSGEVVDVLYDFFW
jgi:hypothetical protein